MIHRSPVDESFISSTNKKIWNSPSLSTNSREGSEREKGNEGRNVCVCVEMKKVRHRATTQIHKRYVRVERVCVGGWSGVG